MKKFITPAILFAAVFLTTLLKQEFTLLGQENVSLFLLTPDYLRETFSSPLPLSHLLGNFLAQYFRFAYVGPVIYAAEITVVFLLLGHALRRLKGGEPAATILACAAWWLSARANNPSEAAAFVLFSGIIFAVSLLFQRKTAYSYKFSVWRCIACAAIAAIATITIFNDRKVAGNEEIASIEQYAFIGNWNKVLDIATPDYTADNPEMLPYALLALNYKGHLSSTARYFPIEGQDDLEGNGYLSYHGYMSGALVYNALGCRNEAIHRLFQAGTYLPHGNSLLILRTLIAHYYALGDYTIARKYCDILSRSTSHKKYVRYYRENMEGKADRLPDSAEKSSEARIMTHFHSRNLKNLQDDGIVTALAADRFTLSVILENTNY